MNLASLIERHDAARVAVIVGDRPVRYGELRERVASLAAALWSTCAAGDRVAIVCGNDDDFVVAYLASLAVGTVAVPLNPASPGPELARQLAVVGASVALVGSAAEEAVVATGAIAGPVVVMRGGTGGNDAVPLDAFVARGHSADRVSAPAVGGDAAAVLLFTSGTAGAPRAAVLSHANLLSNLDQLIAHPGGLADQPRVVLGVLPLHHVFGLNAVLGLTLRLGGTVVLHDHLDPERVARDLVEHQVEVVAGAPTMWRTLAEAGLPPAAFVPVRYATSGAAHLPADTARLVAERLGVELRQGYGLTECSPVVTSAVGTDAPTGSVGIPIPGVEVRLVDRDGDDVLVDDDGEVWVRGPNVFRGYWGDSEASDRVRAPGGWLRTGDIGVVDDRGHVYLVDRSKDLIIVSGFNVHPLEVEAVLEAHPVVAAAAVVGTPDHRTGESVLAYVTLRSGAGGDPRPAVDPSALVEHCRAQLARYKCPGRIEVVDELPLGLNGKVLRRELRDR